MEATPLRRTILCVQTGDEVPRWLIRTLPAYDWVFVTSAYEAIRSLHSRSLDAYVLEYWLPDWAGTSLCREIRKYDPNGPVVFLTNANGDDDQKRGLRAGANAYVCKPADPRMLSTTLQRLFHDSDLRSLRAKPDAEQAVREVLERSVMTDMAPTVKTSAQSIERIARARAYKAFLASGGTKAHFHSYWSQVFEGAQANFMLSSDSHARVRAPIATAL